MRRKKFLVILMMVVMLGGCGENNPEKENISTNSEKEEMESPEKDDFEQLKEEGYENIAEIAYAKMNNEEIRLIYISDNPEESLYLAAKLMVEIEEEKNLIITWKDKEYEISEEKAGGSEENVWKLFPEDWNETIDKVLSGSSIQYLVSKGSADRMDEEIEEFIKNYTDNESEKPNTKGNQNESDNTNTEEAEIVDKFEWKYDENNYYTVGIFKDKETGKEKISAFGHYEEGNMGLMQNDYILIFALSHSAGIDSSIISLAGEESYFLTMNEGEIVLNTFPSEIEDIPEVYIESSKLMLESLNDFYVKNGLKEKTYNDLIYEDEKVKISFAGISENGVVFWVENLTDVNITIQADSVSINGISSNKIMMSDDVAPQSKGKIVAKCDDFSEGTKVETVGGQLTIIDFGGSFDSYKATFVNVPIE